MAAGDYRSCDVCGCKTFYDANLSYEDAEGDDVPYREAGEEQQWSKHRLGYLGDWAVICSDCAKTHRCTIVLISKDSP